MKLKTIIILLSIPFLSYCQNINDCYPRLKPIVDYRGLEVGKACRYFDPIQIKEKEINIGEFYQITPNWKQKRIYVTDIIRKGRDIVGGERFLKIFNFKGEIIFNTKKINRIKYQEGKQFQLHRMVKFYFGKHLGKQILPFSR